MLNFKPFIFLSAVLFLTACNSGEGDSANVELTTSTDSMSYAAGAFITKQFSNQGVPVNPGQMAQGLAEYYAGSAYLDESQAQSFINRYQMASRTRQGAPFTEADPLPIDTDSMSYALGVDFASQMKEFEVSINENAFRMGSKESQTEGAAKLDDAAVQNQLSQLSRSMQAQQMKKMEEMAEGNIQQGIEFITEKAQEEGVRSTESGLHYKVLREGSGTSPKPTDRVSVHYEGRLIDGKVFDSSYERGEPTEFQLDKVIKGWTEGLQLMKPGAKYQFYIPYNLAYGKQGSPPRIDPGATLVFDVELLEVK